MGYMPRRDKDGIKWTLKLTLGEYNGLYSCLWYKDRSYWKQQSHTIKICSPDNVTKEKQEKSKKVIDISGNSIIIPKKAIMYILGFKDSFCTNFLDITLQRFLLYWFFYLHPFIHSSMLLKCFSCMSHDHLKSYYVPVCSWASNFSRPLDGTLKNSS